MYSKEEIRTKASLVRETVNVVLYDAGLSVDKIYLVGSYANGRCNERSDIDYLVIVKGGKRALTYPSWNDMEKVKASINNKRIHVIYGVSLDAQKSLCLKDPVKYMYKEIEDGTFHQSRVAS
jgi:predicted nucleotidyltransferase